MRYAFCVAEDFNLGVAYLIAYLKSEGHEVRLFFDPLQFKRGYANVPVLGKLLDVKEYNLRQMIKYNPDECLFTCVTATYKWALDMAQQVKRRVGCKVVFGGIHPTLCPDEVRKHEFIDDVCMGDGIRYFGGDFNPDKCFPDREVFYRELPRIHRHYPIFMCSFGCVYNCSFCGNEQLRKSGHHKILRRTVAGCIEELKQMKAGGAKYILFVDDIFTCDRVWLDEFLCEYKDKVNLPFCCFGHVKYLDEDTVNNLKNAGCEAVWIGIQTGSYQLRKDILKRIETDDEIVKACALVKKAGIKLIIDHIFGIPYESVLTNDQSYQFYKGLNPDIVNCYQLLYFPKSQIIESAIKYGYLNTSDIPKIERGEGLNYQQDDRPQKFRDMFMKAMVIIPIGSVIFELLPMWAVKLIIYIKAKRTFIPKVMIANEMFFTRKAIIKWISRILSI